MEFNAEPFWDDFETAGGAKDQNYMRILFRPGYAVQARELTQIQSILQNQIKSFGNHIFKSGSPVSGGHLTIDSTAKYLKLQPQYNGIDIDLVDFADTVILNYSSTDVYQKRAKVIATYESVTAPTLIIKYLGASEFANNEIIQTPVENRGVTATSNCSGLCSVAHIDEGIFYVNGYFVQVQPQTIVLDPYGVSPSYKIGLQINDEVIDESADSNLLDPAQQSFNYQAPGAHRYKYGLDLAKRTLDSPDTSRFFELMRVENGVVTKKVDLPIYSEFQRTLARRTYDESGDYIVNPFNLRIAANTADSTNTSLIVELGAGKAYVKGYPYESAGPQKITISKAQTKANVVDYDLPLEYDNYVYANNYFSGSSGIFDIKQLPPLDLHCVPRANINLTSQTSYNRTYIGTAKVVNFDHDEASNYIINLADINVYANTFTLDANTSASIVAGTGSVSTSTLTVASTNWGTLYPGQYIKWNSGGNVARLVSQLTATTWLMDSPQTIATGTTITAYSTSLLKLPSSFTDLPNAYANVNIKIAGGTPNSNSWIGYTSEIVAYNGASKLITLGSDLPTDQLGVYDNITFSYRIDNLDSLVQAGSGYTSITNGLDIATDSRYAPNLTKIIDTNKNSLIFPLAETNITPDGFSAIDYYHKLQGSVSSLVSGAGSISLAASPGLSYYYGTNGSDLSTTAANNHFIVVITALTAGISPFTVGQPVTMNQTYTNGAVSVTPKITRTSQTSMTVNLGAACNVSSFSYVCSVKSNTINQSVKSKTSYPITAIPTLRASDSASLTGAGFIDVDGRRIDTSNGFVWFTDYAKVNKTPNASDNLYIPDVYGITAVYDSGDPNKDPVAGTATNVTNKYYLDSGQNSVYYDHSKLKLKPGVTPPKGRIMAMVKYYKHDNTQFGYFTAASYPSLDYQLARIPIFTTPDGTEYNLRDCMDFRPSRGIGVLATSSSPFVGMRNPLDTMELSYQYYVPRIDTVVLTPEEGIKILSGTPAKVPSPPVNNIDAMEMYRLKIPAYTSDYRTIEITEIKNKRYTMKDIGVLENRIENLEYYTSLSLAEKAANQKTLQYADATQKEKYGIFVDNFSDLRKSDYRNVDFLCAIENFSLRPYVKVNNLNMELYTYDTDIVRVHDKLVTLPYVEISATKQLASSNVSTVSRYSFATFSGQLTLTPEADEWFSDKIQPEYLGEAVNINDANGLTSNQVYVSAAQIAAADGGSGSIVGFQPLTITKTTSTSSSSWKNGATNIIANNLR